MKTLSLSSEFHCSQWTGCPLCLVQFPAYIPLPFSPLAFPFSSPKLNLPFSCSLACLPPSLCISWFGEKYISRSSLEKVERERNLWDCTSPKWVCDILTCNWVWLDKKGGNSSNILSNRRVYSENREQMQSLHTVLSDFKVYPILNFLSYFLTNNMIWDCVQIVEWKKKIFTKFLNDKPVENFAYKSIDII